MCRPCHAFVPLPVACPAGWRYAGRMRLLLEGLAVVLVATVGAGCGVRRAQYDAAVRDASSARDSKNEADKQLGTAQKEIADQKAQIGELQKELADAKSQPAPAAPSCDPPKPPDTEEIEELRRQKSAAEARGKLFDDLIAKLRKMIDAGKLDVAVRRGQIVIELGTDVLFDEGKTELRPEGQQGLVEIAKVLKSVSGRRFQVAGHTDNLPIATKAYPSNWELSTDRALVVVKLLLKEGVHAAALSAAGYAEVDPVGANGTPQGRAKNRRIEIVLVPNIEDLGIQLKRLRQGAGDKKAEPKKDESKKDDTKQQDARPDHRR